MDSKCDKYRVRSHHVRKVSSVTSRDSGYIWETSFDTEEEAIAQKKLIEENRNPTQVQILAPDTELDSVPTDRSK